MAKKHGFPMRWLSVLIVASFLFLPNLTLTATALPPQPGLSLASSGGGRTQE